MGKWRYMIMKVKEKNAQGKSKKFSISTVLYVIASIVAIAGTALLVDNIFIFKTAVAQYITQGYTSSVILESLIPSQLVPSILEPIGLYGGIAFILLGLGIVNTKISKLTAGLSNDEKNNNIIVGNIEVKDIADTEPSETIEIVDPVKTV